MARVRPARSTSPDSSNVRSTRRVFDRDQCKRPEISLGAASLTAPSKPVKAAAGQSLEAAGVSRSDPRAISASFCQSPLGPIEIASHTSSPTRDQGSDSRGCWSTVPRAQAAVGRATGTLE